MDISQEFNSPIYSQGSSMIYEIFDSFNQVLWKIRLDLGRTIKNENKIDDIKSLLLAQKIIDRIIFICFLGEKEMIRNSNDKIIKAQELFEIICKEEHPYTALKNLIFDLFVKPHDINDEYMQSSNNQIIKIPYIGGRLFQNKKISINKKIIREYDIKVEKFDWNKIFKTLNSYRWILEEKVLRNIDYSSKENQNIISPDILGYIYEKFVITMETLSKMDMDLDINNLKLNNKEMMFGNKIIGAYYTPKEITHYMAKNTIYPYILDKLNAQYKNEHNEIWVDLLNKNKLTNKEIDYIKYIYFEILKKLKICDNACGSGAFLITILEILCDIFLKCVGILKTQPFFREEYEKLIKNSNLVYNIRKMIVTHNIYGVDVQESALENAKNRLFLSLIAVVNPELGKFEPLPSLEYNLLSGNALIGFSKLLKSDLTIFSELDKKTQLIENLKNTNNSVKLNAALEELNKINRKIRIELDRAYFIRIKNKIKITKDEFSRLKPFHWALEFSKIFSNDDKNINNGFDIIVGNPPYIENKKMKGELIHKDLQKLIYKSAYKLYDYSIIFIERSWKLLKEGGYFAYIVPNKFCATDYGEKIRNLIIEKTEMKQLLDVSKIELFRKIATYPIIIIFKKTKEKNDNKVILGLIIKDLSEISNNSFKKFSFPQKKFLEIPGQIFPISSNLTLSEKIRNLDNIITVADLGGNEMRYRLFGFTGYDSIFQKVNQEPPKKGDYLKFIGTKNIQNFAVNENSVFQSKGFKFQNSFLAYEHEFKEIWDFLIKEKLLIKEVSKNLVVSYDPGIYANVTGMYMFIPKKKYPNINIFYLLGILNSKLISFVYKTYYENTHMKGDFLNFHKTYLLFLPIKVPSKIESEVVEFLSKCLYTCARAENSNFMYIIDLLNLVIYEIYFRKSINTEITKYFSRYIHKFEDLENVNVNITKINELVRLIIDDNEIVRKQSKILANKNVRIIHKSETIDYY